MRAPDDSSTSHNKHVDSPLASSPVRILVDGFLCRLHIWSDDEWAALAETDRPIRAERLDGLGWVGAIPEACLN
jgi:hypothetical protein